jgi:hypothetical protein
MLPGFEEQTKDLSPEERKLVAAFVTSLSRRVGEENAIKSDQIIATYQKSGFKMSGARVRKIISFIREECMVPGLIATSKGYYVSNDPAKIYMWIQSLEGRETKIRMIRKKAEDYLYTLKNKGQQKLEL